MTTVRPVNSRMYGSASARITAFSPAISIRASWMLMAASRGPAVLVDVGVGKVSGEHDRFAVRDVQVTKDLDLAARQLRGERGFVVRTRDAVTTGRDAVVRDVDAL